MSSTLLILCVISAIIIKLNVSLGFSLKIVALVALVNIGTLLNQIFSWQYEHTQNDFLIVM